MCAAKIFKPPNREVFLFGAGSKGCRQKTEYSAGRFVPLQKLAWDLPHNVVSIRQRIVLLKPSHSQAM